MSCQNVLLRYLVVLALLVAPVACSSDSSTDNRSPVDAGSDVTDSEPPDITQEDALIDALDVPDEEDLPPDPNRIEARFDPAGEGFYRMPWPSDYRLTEDGHPDLSDFPERTNIVVKLFIDGIQEVVVGFSTLPVVYVGFDGPLDAAAMPSPAESLLADSSVRLIAVDSTRCGEPVPVVVAFHPEGDKYLDDNVLTAMPVPGFVLEPTTSYALLVMRDIPAEGDRYVEPPAEFRAVVDGSSGLQGLEETFAPLVTCAAESGIDLAEVAVATVFTTQDPVGELLEIVEFVLDSDAVADPAFTGFGNLAGGGSTDYGGSYETPIFQRGVSPYAVEGGGFEFEDDGTPILQGWEALDFIVSLPDGTDGPYPIMLWEDGSGAEVDYFLRDRDWMPAAYHNGFAIATFEQPFVGSREVPGGTPGMTSSVLNPEGARTSPRQQTVDTAYFLRVLSTLSEEYPELDLDPSRIVFGGQSQGANIGAIAAGSIPGIDGYALNGVGGHLTYSILDRTTEPTMSSIVAGALLISEDELSPIHPMLAMLQMAGDAADPINYASAWTGWGDHLDGSHVFLINGFNDPYVPPSCSGALIVAGGATPLVTPGWEVDPHGVWPYTPLTMPASGNRTSQNGRSLTLVSHLNSSTGHFTTYDRRQVADATGVFWAGAFDGAPVVDIER